MSTTHTPFSFRKRSASFRHALRGLRYALMHEHNLRIHFILFTLAVCLAFALGCSALEWLALLIVSAAVLAAELLNSSLEGLCDLVSPHFHPQIGRVKDMAAGAVLVTATAAFITGLILFVPKLIHVCY